MVGDEEEKIARVLTWLGFHNMEDEDDKGIFVLCHLKVDFDCNFFHAHSQN